MRVIGICRFSYPALGGFKRMHATVAEREAYLYAPQRMALRFAHFESLVLPSLRAQTDPDFTFLIVIGHNMPEPWLSKLHALCARSEFAGSPTRPLAVSNGCTPPWPSAKPIFMRRSAWPCALPILNRWCCRRCAHKPTRISPF